MTKTRETKQAYSITEILSFLSSGKNVWVGKNYSLEQLKKDLENLL